MLSLHSSYSVIQPQASIKSQHLQVRHIVGTLCRISTKLLGQGLLQFLITFPLKIVPLSNFLFCEELEFSFLFLPTLLQHMQGISGHTNSMALKSHYEAKFARKRVPKSKLRLDNKFCRLPDLCS